MSAITELIQIFSDITEKKAMEQLFNELFTDSERKDFALRWQSLKRVHKKVPQRQIAADLKISLCKITRASKVLKNEKSIFRQILDKKQQ